MNQHEMTKDKVLQDSPYDAGDIANMRDLISETRNLVTHDVPPELMQAQEIAWRWLRMSSAFSAFYPLVTLAQSGTRSNLSDIGILPADAIDWIAQAVVHARVTLFSKYLTQTQATEVLRRQISHANDWQSLFVEVRRQMDNGASVTDPEVRELARRWESLFRDSYYGDDLELEERVRQAIQKEPDLMLGLGLDFTLIAFIHSAILLMNRPQHKTDNSGPKPSAQRVATLRAVHQLVDFPIVLNDPLALKILGEKDEAALRAQPRQYNDFLSKGLRTSLVVRARLAEDKLEEAYAKGVAQYVILGAGLDTYAYRTNLPDVRVFEVDLPDTQKWKRERLRSAQIAAPNFLTYVPIDFEKDTLARALGEAGFRRDRPAFFSWLGVTMYLEEDAIMDTLRFIASSGRGSSVVFDYLLSPSLLTPIERLVLQQVATNIAEHGEPWKTYFDPRILEEKLIGLGYAAANNQNPEDLNNRYLSNRKDGMRLGNTSRLMHAIV